MKTCLLLLPLFLLYSCDTEELTYKDDDCRKQIFPLSAKYEKEATSSKFTKVKLVCYDTKIGECAMIANETEVAPDSRKEKWFYQNLKSGKILLSSTRLTKNDGYRIQQEVVDKANCFDM